MEWDDIASRSLCEVWLRAASLVNSPCCGTHPAHAACTKRRSLGDKELRIPSTLKKGVVVCKKKSLEITVILGFGIWENVPFTKSFSFIWAIHWDVSPRYVDENSPATIGILSREVGGNLKEKIPEVRMSTPQMKGWNLKIMPKFLNEQEPHFPSWNLISWKFSGWFFKRMHPATLVRPKIAVTCGLGAWMINQHRRESVVMIYRPNRRDYSCTKLLTYSTYKLHTSYPLLLILFQHCLPGIYNHNYTLKDQHRHRPWISNDINQ